MPEVVRDAFAISADGREATHREAGTRIQLVPISSLDILEQVREAAETAARSDFSCPNRSGEIETSGRYGP